MAVRAWDWWSQCIQSDPERWMHVLGQFRHLIQSRTPAPVTVLPTFLVDLPIPVRSLWKCPHKSQPEMGLLDDAKPCLMSVEINRHTCPSRKLLPTAPTKSRQNEAVRTRTASHSLFEPPKIRVGFQSTTHLGQTFQRHQKPDISQRQWFR